METVFRILQNFRRRLGLWNYIWKIDFKWPFSQNAFVAEQENELIGLVHYIYHPHNWKIEDVCYLQDLFVLKTARGTGVGRALIESVYLAADRNGTPTVYWLTQDFNEQARKLYDNIGTITSFIKYNRN